MIGRIAELVILMQHPEAGDYKPEEGNRAKNPEGDNDGKRAIMIVAYEFRCFHAAAVRASNLRLFGGAKGIAFADEEVLGDFRNDVAPHVADATRVDAWASILTRGSSWMNGRTVSER